MRATLSERRWLWATLGFVVAIWAILWRFHETSPTDPWDTVLIGMMGGMAALLIIFMVATRREWPAEALGLFCLLLGDVMLWGVVGFATRMDWIARPTPEWISNLLRAAFFAASLILLVYMARWLWWRWRERS